MFQIDKSVKQEGEITIEMNLFTLPDNCSNSIHIPISSAIQPLASITTLCNESKAVLLNATIGWTALKSNMDTHRTTILFSIWRGAPISGILACSVRDSNEAHTDQYKTTSFFHVDEINDNSNPVTYLLAAELVERDSSAAIIGGLTFFCLELK